MPCRLSQGDNVCIYMPMTPYAIYSMLACARIGAVRASGDGMTAGNAGQRTGLS